MPPNRKTTYESPAHSVNGADLLSGFVNKSPYPTLTSQDATASGPPPKSPDSEKERFVLDILEQERARQLVSADHVQENLVRESKQQQQERLQPVSKVSVSSNDNYWMMPASNAIEPKFAQANSKAATCAHGIQQQPVAGLVQEPDNETNKQRNIELILEDERVRQLFQADHVEELIVQEAAALSRQEQATLKAEYDAYWAM